MSYHAIYSAVGIEPKSSTCYPNAPLFYERYGDTIICRIIHLIQYYKVFRELLANNYSSLHYCNKILFLIPDACDSVKWEFLLVYGTALAVPLKAGFC